MKSTARFCFILLALCLLQLQSRQQGIRQYSVADGLSQSTIQAINQDVFGIIWISTGDGLNSFDGHTFGKYYSWPAVSTSGQSNSMRNVISDPIGNLWVGSDFGLLYLDRSKQILSGIFPEIKELTGRACLPLFCSDDSVSVLVKGLGILTINKDSHKFEIIPLNSGLVSLSALGSGKDEIWFGFYPDNLVCFSKTENSLLSMQDFSTGSKVHELFVSVLKLDSSRYLAATATKLYLLSKTDGSMRTVDHRSWSIFPEDVRFKSLQTDHTGNILVITINRGIYILNSDFSLHSHIPFSKSTKGESKSEKIVTTAFTDDADNLWIGTDGSGLCKFRAEPPVFSLVNNIMLPSGESLLPFIRCFYEDDDGQMWIGTHREGLFRWNRKSGEFTQYIHENEKNFPSLDDLYCIQPLDKNNLLLGTSSGIAFFDKTKSRIQSVLTFCIGTQKISQILRLQDRRFAVILNSRLYYLEPVKRNWELTAAQLPDAINVEAICIAPDNGLYGFSRNGYYTITGEKTSFVPFTYNDQEVMLDVNAVIPVNEGGFWMATGNGLIRTDSTGAVIENYNENDGLSNHFLYGMLSDNNGHLWMSSNNGLSRFSIETKKFRNFGLADGLQSLEFNSGAFLKTSEGEMFFGGIEGFNFFHPDTVADRTHNPLVMLTGIMVNDQALQTDTCPMAMKFLELPYNQNTLTFEFAALDFNNTPGSEYYYFLAGHDHNWISAGQLNRARYSRLKPGKYVFKVRAIHDFDNPQINEATLRLTILKPFWLTTIFLIVVFIAVVSVVVFIVRYFIVQRMKKQIEKLKREQEISNIRRRIASDLHDDIGSGLSKLAMISDRTRLKSSHDNSIGSSLSKISVEARQMIDQLRVIVWALNPQNDQLDNLIAYIRMNVGDYLEDAGFNYEISVQGIIPEKYVSAEFKRNVYYTIREAVHNCVKHAGTCKIFIGIEITPATLKVSVIDDGNGFDVKVLNSNGNGLRFMKKRIDDLGGTFSASENKARGISIVLSVPL
jgi:signal transduction histidine kinase/ligand-binding sensor domain-containing protein